MRTSGLLCRATPDCEAAFAVERQDSMDSLREAAARRDAHELEVHGYTHEVRPVEAATPFQQPAVRRPRAPRRSEDLTIA